MINVNDLKNGVTVKYDNNLFIVLEFQHVKPGKGPAFVRTKLKNLRTGAIIDNTFNAGIKLETAHINKYTLQYLYKNGSSYTFMNTETYDQLDIDGNKIKEESKYLKDNLEVEVVFYEDEMLGISLPDKVSLKVVLCEPAVKGNTTNNAMKEATLETGLTIKVPLFIEQDEEILVSTKDGKYVSRA